ncbi:50S ribosomal protein L27 [Candidatus Azambacteria bacterium RIFOXYC1_FULL_41_20]|nr:MAG: 50S ribosomal protein L27 [Candidatus Azambacteria bacterium RIFOXYB1_FULL_40_33]OGD42468.1 MAG: 50S ribosomal protein L27 [Candidatus Azambacteria bacterium RIFOXYA1_FULL_42_37]OGD42944.1 MAG: 50S ribosomal protein L27 [Candidatus Azambacteria bacterium RIFCSPLOWO2_02_FULL_42_10]OGD43578.1 MAG: 50S ribosomal protein L27 [Candidatus Azambacteria bacterium RIFOXYC1_FULL_41_20]OGD47371.1 MAG: 50S ribosomal protein L27 [Candidatus Azambacteria bacterium RIFOXYD1_FULL_42_38]HAJ44735.1 50S 
MAHTKAAGSTRLGRESHSKRLGVKLFDGEKVAAGNIIIRQRGSKWLPGVNVKRGSDDTLYALKAGNIKFSTKKIKRFNGSRRIVKMVNVQ